MSSFAYLFDLQGNMLDEIDGIFRREWKLNTVGKCSFTYPVGDAKFKKGIFQPGNHIVVLHNGGLPKWGGKLLLPRKWGNGTVKIECLSAGNIFNSRYGPEPPIMPYMKSGVPGNVYREIVKVANDSENALLVNGDIFDASRKGAATQISPATPLMTNIAQIVQQSKEEWDVTPLVVNNRLTLLANWYQQRGRKINRALNNKNCKIVEDSLTEKGPIWNRIFAFDSTGSTTNYYVAVDEDSRKEFGLFAKPLPVSSSDSTAIGSAAISELERYAWPTSLFNATLNYDEALIAEVADLGNKLPFENAEAGFGDNGKVGTDTWTRIYGMAFTDGDSEVALTLNKEGSA